MFECGPSGLSGVISAFLVAALSIDVRIYFVSFILVLRNCSPKMMERQFMKYRPLFYRLGRWGILFGLLPLLFGAPGRAATPEEPRAKAEEENEESGFNALERRLEEQELRIKAQEEKAKKYEQLIEAQRAEIENIKSRQDATTQMAESQAEDEELQLMMNEEEKRQQIRFFGFSDFLLYKLWVDKDAMMRPLFNDNFSFTMMNLNLFMDHQLSDSFRYMAEVRFSTLPHGSVTVVGTEISKQQNTVMDPTTLKSNRWGSITIVRAYLEYKPMDYFAVRIGRFLTPYGIWNVDHATPVIIAGHTPNTMMIGLIPETQTGISIYGHVYPFAKIRLDYGLTLSNGRGPFDEILDLDNNKGLGFRVRFGWDGDYKFLIGTYLYMGDYTDSKYQLTSMEPVEFREEKTEWYSEKAAAFDLLFELKGLRLQGEYVISSRVYHDQKRGSNFFTQTPLPDYYSQGLYVLVAYQLPFEQVDLRPYLMFDRFDLYDFSDDWEQDILTGGINWRFNPHVVLKIEYYWMFTFGELQLHGINNQLAVSF